MKNVLSPSLVKIAHRVAGIPFAKKLLKPFYYSYKRSLVDKRNKAFRDNALSTLEAFDACMQKNGYPYTLIFGTMLGAVREHGFIRHDVDIDVAMWKEDYDEGLQIALENAGFKLDHRFLIDEGESAREETYVKDDVSIDVYCVFPPIDDYPYVCSKWRPVADAVTLRDSMKDYGYVTGKRLEMPLNKSFLRVPFESISLPIVSNADEVLSFYYGDDYLSPNPQWVERGDFPYRKPWPEKKAIYRKWD